MIVNSKRAKRNEILKGRGNVHIAFIANTEGRNEKSLSKEIATKYWPEIANIGVCRMGTVIEKEVEGIHFYGLVCYSLERGFIDGAENICKCLDKISTDETIFLEVSGEFSGHAFFEIRNGIEKSQKKVIIYKVSENKM